ncbi:hypothetical protein [Saccharopolyspora rectivirgula]
MIRDARMQALVAKDSRCSTRTARWGVCLGQGGVGWEETRRAISSRTPGR